MSMLINPYRFASGTSSLLTNLLAWWPLDETSGTRVDAHGSYDLTDYNTAGYTTGVISNAASFVAANTEALSRTGLTSTALTPGTSDFTCCGWAKFDSGSDSGAVIIGMGKHTDLRDGDWYIRRNLLSEEVNFSVRKADDSAAVFSSDKAITYSTFFFFCAEFNSSNQTIYLDVNNSGSPVSAAVGQNCYTDSTNNNFAIGSRGGLNASWLNGVVDEVAIWNRLLTSGEKAALYNSGSGMAYPG